MNAANGSVLLITNQRKPRAEELAAVIAAHLRQAGYAVTDFRYAGVADSVPHHEEYLLAITLGGDGTVLFATRALSGRSVPILPINLGEFGFISEVQPDDWRSALDSFLSGRIDAGRRLLLDVRVSRAGEQLCGFRGLNDAVVSAEGLSRMVQLQVSLTDRLLGLYRADGVIVATPTGSTAYSAAAGGPILHPEMNALVLNPICPFTLSHRPIVLPPDEKVRISVVPDQRTDVALTVDGQTLTPLLPGDLLTVRAADTSAHIVRFGKRTFYEVLRSKLHWAGGPRD